jgi:hypothetical protein
VIADCQLAIFDWRPSDKANGQSEIENWQSRDPLATRWWDSTPAKGTASYARLPIKGQRNPFIVAEK